MVQNACTRSFPIHVVDRPLNKLMAGAQWLATRSGIAASNIWEAGGLVRGSVGGVDFQTTGLRLSAGVSSDGPVSFSAGPIIGLRLSRSGSVDDEVVDQLPDRNVGVEAGVIKSYALTHI